MTEMQWTEVAQGNQETQIPHCEHTRNVDSAAVELMRHIANFAVLHHVHDGQLQATDSITAVAGDAAWKIDVAWTLTPTRKAAGSVN